MTTGSTGKPHIVAKSRGFKSKPMRVAAASASDSDSSRLSYVQSDRDGNGDNDDDSSDGGSADGDFDITGLPEKEAQQVLNDEVIFFTIYSYLLNTNNV